MFPKTKNLIRKLQKIADTIQATPIKINYEKLKTLEQLEVGKEIELEWIQPTSNGLLSLSQYKSLLQVHHKNGIKSDPTQT